MRHRERPNLLLRRSAGGNRRLAAVTEPELHVRGVLHLGQDSSSHRTHSLHPCLDQIEHDVEVMDHQIEDHPIIFDPRLEGTHAAALDQDGVSHDILELLHSPIKAFHMSYVEHGAASPGEIEQLSCLRERRRNGLFDEDMDSGIQELACDGVMEGRGNSDADDIHFADQRPVIGQAHRIVCLRQFLSLVGVHIDDADELHIGKLCKDGDMVASHLAHPDDSRSDWPHLPPLE